LLGARADREHRDDGADAEDHPEHRQGGAQLVDGEVLKRPDEGFARVHARPPRAGPPDAAPPAGLLTGFSGAAIAMTSPVSSPEVTTTRPTAEAPSVTGTGEKLLPRFL